MHIVGIILTSIYLAEWVLLIFSNKIFLYLNIRLSNLSKQISIKKLNFTVQE